MIKRCLVVLIVVLVLPVSACANAGTPLMWAGMLHLMFGNALIGAGEGWLISRLTGASKKFCVPAMVAANYLSAWVGSLLLSRILAGQPDLHLYNAQDWIWRMTALTYGMTLVLEWPFVALCLRKMAKRRGTSIWTNILVQTVSYVLIFTWYWRASGKSIYTGLETVPPSAIATKSDADVYFISSDDGDIYSVDLNGSHRKRLYVLGSTNANDRLAAAPSGTNGWSLLFRSDDITDSNQVRTVAKHLTGHVIEDWIQTRSGQVEGTRWNFGPVSNLGKTNEWRFFSGFWGAQGIDAHNGITGERLRFALETPFVTWTVRNATQVSEDQVVFQLGRDQICFFDLGKRQIALIARGRGPVTVVGPESERVCSAVRTFFALHAGKVGGAQPELGDVPKRGGLLPQ